MVQIPPLVCIAPVRANMSFSDSMVASNRRPLRVRLRSDLNFINQTWQGRDYVVVKDPLTLRFYRFEAEEHALMQLLDGHRSAEQIRERFGRQFAPWEITHGELFQFIGSLHRNNLVVSDAPGQAPRLLARDRQNRRRQRIATWTNILAIRFRGFDPDRILSGLNRTVGWFFSWPCVVVCLLLMASALSVVLVNFETFGARLPAFETFFSGGNWVWLALVLVATKILHELGHGIACKRMGSQCHSMGLMFLVLMPCLYCDVTDSWTLPSRWRRAAIAAAGMYVEFVLAAICTFLWWFSEPGLLNMLALNVVVVCSVSTLLFNANPLLRYDGYYILSDLIEIPNLRQKASRVLTRFASRVILGIESPPDPFMPVRRRWLFGLYSVLAVAYRWFIMLAIFWFLYELLEPAGLKIVGQLIALMALYGLVARPLVQFIRFMKTPGRIYAVKPVRASLAGGLALALLIGILAIPVPHYVRCSFVLQPAGISPVYVEVPGSVADIQATPGQSVEAGQRLLLLSSPRLQQSVVALEGERLLAETRHRIRLKQASYNPRAEQDVETTEAVLASATRQLEQKLLDVRRLSIVAPVSGTVLAAGYRPAEDDEQQGRLGNWHGHPLETANRGAWLESGTIVCSIAPAHHRTEAILAIDQSDIEFVTSGNPVRLWTRQSPGETINSEIDLISLVEMREVPRGLSNRWGGDLPTRPDAQDREVPLSTTYQVRVPLGNVAQGVVPGATGVARIRTGNQTLGRRIWRMACKTFRFDL